MDKSPSRNEKENNNWSVISNSDSANSNSSQFSQKNLISKTNPNLEDRQYSAPKSNSTKSENKSDKFVTKESSSGQIRDEAEEDEKFSRS